MDIKLFRRRSFFRAPTKMQSIENAGSQSINEQQLINNLHSYYFNGGNSNTDSLYTKDSIQQDNVTQNVQEAEIQPVDSYTTSYVEPFVKPVLKPIEQTTSNKSNCKHDSFVCSICENKTSKQDKYIILSCNHIFHISCLAETHFEDIYNYNVIDNEYFSTRKCKVCSEHIQMSELLFLHSKFLSDTKDKIDVHSSSIEQLENKMKVIKEELKVCYDYKHKLEQEREKSKQIITTLAYYQP